MSHHNIRRIMNRLTRKEAVNVVKCIKYLKGVVEDNKLPRALLTKIMMVQKLLSRTELYKLYIKGLLI